MPKAPPFAIRLTATEGPGLRAVLRNESPVEQVFLHESNLQPSRLVLVNGSGVEATAFDSRSVKKFDNTVLEAMYARLAPGSEAPFGEVRFTRGGDGFEVTWGPFQFEKLPPGAYKARVVWKSAQDSWTDTEAGTHGRVAGIWLGEVRSNEVDLILPR